MKLVQGIKEGRIKLDGPDSAAKKEGFYMLWKDEEEVDEKRRKVSKDAQTGEVTSITAVHKSLPYVAFLGPNAYPRSQAPSSRACRILQSTRRVSAH